MFHSEAYDLQNCTPEESILIFPPKYQDASCHILRLFDIQFMLKIISLPSNIHNISHSLLKRGRGEEVVTGVHAKRKQEKRM